MIKFKSCPECRGDLFITRDGQRWYMLCLSCSFSRERAKSPMFYEIERDEVVAASL